MVRRRLLLVLVAAVMVLMTVAATAFSVHTDRGVASRARDQALTETSRAAQELVGEAVARVSDVADLFATSHVSAKTFSDFTDPMLDDSGATSIAWTRVVPAAGRGAVERDLGGTLGTLDAQGRRTTAPRAAQYAVTTFVKTPDDNIGRIGIDEASDPARAAAMSRATRTSSAQSTGPLAIRGTSERGFVIYVPVYPPGTLGSEVVRPIGFVSGTFSFADSTLKLQSLIPAGTAAALTIEDRPAIGLGTLQGTVAHTQVMVAGQRWQIAVGTPAQARQALGLTRGESAFIAFTLLSLLIGGLLWQAMVGARRADELSRLRQRERDQAIRQRDLAEETTRELLANLPDLAVLRFDQDLRVVTAQGGLLDRAGWVASEMEGALASDLFAGHPGKRLRDAMQGALDGKTSAFSARGLREAELVYWTQTIPLPGEPRSGLLVANNVSTVLKAETARDQARARFKQVFEDAPVGMAIVSTHGNFVQANDAMAHLTGYSVDELTGGMGPMDVTHPDDLATTKAQIDGLLTGRTGGTNVEKRYVHKDGHVVWIALHTTVLPDADGKTEFVLAHIIDVTDRHEFAEQLQHLADHDPLTELRNRRSFEQALESQIAVVQRYGPEGALLVLDLDHFKAVNDTAGHQAGDRVLEIVADVLRASLRASDVIGRLGGDEFAVMLPKADEQEARIVALKIGEQIRTRCAEVHFGEACSVTASIGVVVLDATHASGDQALVAADRAMYEAKAAGRDRFAFAEAVPAETPPARHRT